MNFYIIATTLMSLIVADDVSKVIVNQIFISNPIDFCKAITSTGPINFNFEKCDSILIEYEADYKTSAEFNLEKSVISIISPYKLFSIKLFLDHDDFDKKTMEVHGNIIMSFGSCEQTSVYLINVLDYVWKTVDIVNPAKTNSVGQIKIDNPSMTFDTNHLGFNVGTGTNTQMVVKKVDEAWMINVKNGSVDLKGSYMVKEGRLAAIPSVVSKDVKFTFTADENTKVVISSNLCPEEA